MAANTSATPARLATANRQPPTDSAVNAGDEDASDASRGEPHRHHNEIRRQACTTSDWDITATDMEDVLILQCQARWRA